MANTSAAFNGVYWAFQIYPECQKIVATKFVALDMFNSSLLEIATQSLPRKKIESTTIYYGNKNC